MYLTLLLSQSHLKHKNWKIREQLLHIIVTLLDIYGEEVAVTNDLTPQVASMLTDAQSSIRALVVDVLGRLYAIFGDVFMVELGSNSKIKPNHIRAIKEVAAQQVEGGLEISIPINRVDSGTGGSVSSVSSAQSSPGNISTGEGQNNRKPGIGKSKSDVARRVSGLGGTGRVMSLKSKESFSNTTGHMPSFSRNSSSNSVMSGDSVKDGAAFSPLWYLSLLSESKTTQTIYPSSEKDLARIFSGIIDEIKKQDDWQARVAGLGKLQALVTGICYVEGENGDPALKNALIDELKATPVSDLVWWIIFVGVSRFLYLILFDLICAVMLSNCGFAFGRLQRGVLHDSNTSEVGRQEILKLAILIYFISFLL